MNYEFLACVFEDIGENILDEIICCDREKRNLTKKSIYCVSVGQK